MLIILRTFRLSSWWGTGREWALVRTPVGVVCFACRVFVPGTGPHHYDRSGPRNLAYYCETCHRDERKPDPEWMAAVAEDALFQRLERR